MGKKRLRYTLTFEIIVSSDEEVQASAELLKQLVKTNMPDSMSLTFSQMDTQDLDTWGF